MATVMVYVVDSFPARPKNKRTHHAQLTSPSRASCHGPSLAKCLLICSCRPACRGDGPMGPPLLLLLRLCMVLVGYSISWLDIRFDIYIYIYSILIWVVWPLLWIRFSPTLDSHPNEKIARRKGSTRCAENGDDKQKSAPFRRAIHYCSCAVFAATEVMHDAWLEASFGGSDPPSLKSSPISRCREPAHAKFLVELAGAMARSSALGRWAHFWRNPPMGCCHCLGSAALSLSIIKPRIPRLQQLYALSAR